MSFGSYQQFCEQRRHTLAAAAAAGHGTTDVGLGFDMHLPSHFPPVGNTSSPGLSNFYGAPPGATMQPPHAPHQLPSSFFTSQDPASQPLPGNCETVDNIKKIDIDKNYIWQSSVINGVNLGKLVLYI